jgi:hypothetical protein
MSEPKTEAKDVELTLEKEKLRDLDLPDETGEDIKGGFGRVCTEARTGCAETAGG